MEDNRAIRFMAPTKEQQEKFLEKERREQMKKVFGQQEEKKQ